MNKRLIDKKAELTEQEQQVLVDFKPGNGLLDGEYSFTISAKGVFNTSKGKALLFVEGIAKDNSGKEFIFNDTNKGKTFLPVMDADLFDKLINGSTIILKSNGGFSEFKVKTVEAVETINIAETKKGKKVKA